PAARAPPPAPPRRAGEADGPPPRHHRLAPAERHPAHYWAADADTDVRGGPAEEGNECRRVDGPHNDGSRRPRPEAVHVDPAPVVVRCPAPRRGVDPRPAVVGVEGPRPRAV